MNKKQKAYFHLPGLFEFFDLYQVFLPLFQEHREFFYDWCEIGSVYGAPSACIWGGGRMGVCAENPREVLDFMQRYGISSRLTFSNSLLEERHLSDNLCNRLCRWLEEDRNIQNGVIVHSELLLQYLQEQYPDLYLVSSTTKVLTVFQKLVEELDRPEFRYVVPDFRLNKSMEQWATLTKRQKEKVEFLCNECCWIGCSQRKKCYETVSRRILGEDVPEHICRAPAAEQGYRFSKAMENPSFISVDDIVDVYMPMGFSQFKIEGRGLGSALVLEFLLHYLTKPSYQIHVREAIYLDNMLDLF